MAANRFGERFCVATFGESHGPALGVVIDGCPAGVDWDNDLLKSMLVRRRPSGSEIDKDLVSGRAELDEPEVLSGVFESKTIGTPIAIIVRNRDARSQDYQDGLIRRGHADDLWKKKFRYSDPRGGGRASGRETVARVMAGAVAQMVLASELREMRPVVNGFSFQIGPYQLKESDLIELRKISSKERQLYIEKFPARFPSPSQSDSVVQMLRSAKTEGKSYGGRAVCWIDSVPESLGQPVFHKFKSDLAAAVLSIGATTSLAFGAGESWIATEGSEVHSREDRSMYGGIRGGITSGEPVHFEVGFKPTASVLDIAKKGRHDPCIVPRAIPVIESMTLLVLTDHLLWRKTDRIN